MSSKQLDATLIAGDSDNQFVTGILCYNQKTRQFVDSHPRAIGSWNQDTFWMKISRVTDLATVVTDMVKAGLIVE